MSNKQVCRWCGEEIRKWLEQWEHKASMLVACSGGNHVAEPSTPAPTAADPTKQEKNEKCGYWTDYLENGKARILPTPPSPSQERGRDCDLTRGDVQCSAKLMTVGDGYLCCRYIAGHVGKHKTSYTNGTEWEESITPTPSPSQVSEPEKKCDYWTDSSVPTHEGASTTRYYCQLPSGHEGFHSFIPPGPRFSHVPEPDEFPQMGCVEFSTPADAQKAKKLCEDLQNEWRTHQESLRKELDIHKRWHEAAHQFLDELQVTRESTFGSVTGRAALAERIRMLQAAAESQLTAARQERDELQEELNSAHSWLAEYDGDFGGVRAMFAEQIRMLERGEIDKAKQHCQNILSDVTLPKMGKAPQQSWAKRIENQREQIRQLELKNKRSVARAAELQADLIHVNKKLKAFQCLEEHLPAGYDLGDDATAALAVELTEARERIGELEKARGWISVKDRLPEKDGLYLVWTPAPVVEEHPRTDVYYFRVKVGDKQQRNWGWETVTHWQPLPEPPEKALKEAGK